ncbi:MAG: hypothetical protein J6A55_00930 [Oscillospiraceae bacterium]|nr:hypothetical protein [Oscillospiraceae bacterium]
MKQIGELKLENNVTLKLFELGNNYAKIYKRAVKAVEVCDIRKAVGGQKGQHQHRKSD